MMPVVVVVRTKTAEHIYIYISQETQESEVYDSKRYHIRTSPTPLAMGEYLTNSFMHSGNERGGRSAATATATTLSVGCCSLFICFRMVVEELPQHTPIHRCSCVSLLGDVFIRGYELDLCDAKDIPYRYSSIFVRL
jgi:hypothetical protein